MSKQVSQVTVTAVEQEAVNALMSLLRQAHHAGDALTVRAATQALSALSSYYSRNSVSEERNRMPAIDFTALQQAISDHYALATFIAANPALAERQGIALPRWGDNFDSEVDKVLYWRSPEQTELDRIQREEYEAKRAAEKAQEATT